MTLNKKHALLGIALPTAVKDPYGRVFVPDRLHANITSGFANWIMWTEDPLVLKTAIDAARNMARNTTMIQNSNPRMQRSRS